MTVRLQIGSWDKLPNYSVHGEPTSFYVWILKSNASDACMYKAGEQGASGWIRGTTAFKSYNKLKKLLSQNKKEEFISLVEELHKEYT